MRAVASKQRWFRRLALGPRFLDVAVGRRGFVAATGNGTPQHQARSNAVGAPQHVAPLRAAFPAATAPGVGASGDGSFPGERRPDTRPLERHYTPPGAASTYRARLRAGVFASVLDLAAAPYAPPPAVVVVDVIRSTAKEGIAAPAAAAAVTPVGVRLLLAQAASEARAARERWDAAGDAASRDGFARAAAQAAALDGALRGEGDADDVVSLLLDAAETASEVPVGEGLSSLGRWEPLRCLSVAAAVLEGHAALCDAVGGVGAADAAVVSLHRLRGVTARIDARLTDACGGNQNGQRGAEEGSSKEALASLRAFPPPPAWVASTAATQRQPSPAAFAAVVGACRSEAKFGVALRVVCALLAQCDANTPISESATSSDGDSNAASSGSVGGGRWGDAATAKAVDDAVASLAACVRCRSDLRALRSLFVPGSAAADGVDSSDDSDGALVASSAGPVDSSLVGLAARLPVTVPLYTALISACARATDDPQRQPFALALYRALRDGALLPSGATYAALIAVAASVGEATQAFAFFHEARRVVGRDRLPPAAYTQLLAAYATGGYVRDVRATLDVLIAARAPLERAAFDVAIGAAETYREARSLLAAMEAPPFRFVATPATFALVLRALARTPGGGATVLAAAEIHEEALAAAVAAAAPRLPSPALALAATPRGTDTIDSGTAGAVSAPPSVIDGADILATETSYAAALERLLLGVAIPLPSEADTGTAAATTTRGANERVGVARTARALCAVPQRAMSAFWGRTPQRPTRVPHGCVAAVLAADALADPASALHAFARHYSVFVVPYSAVVVARRRAAAAGRSAAHREALRAFLASNAAAVHLLSLEEEVAIGREMARFGVILNGEGSDTGSSDAGDASLAVRCVGVAGAVARGLGPFAPYKATNLRVVLVSDAAECAAHVRLCAPVRQLVWLHSPRDQPNWTPAEITVADQQHSSSSVPPSADSKGVRGAAVTPPTVAEQQEQQRPIGSSGVAVETPSADDTAQNLLDMLSNDCY